MTTEERTFNLRFTISSDGNDVDDDDEHDETNSLDEWETRIKPGLIRVVFAHLRSFDNWTAHVRNRGISPEDEIEIVLTCSRTARA